MNKENCVIANNDEWLQTQSPFEVIDEDMKIIIIFFVFHIPVEGVSARGKSLKEYGWGKKSKANDFKELKRRLIEFGEMNEKYFVCEDNFEKLKNALTENQLIDFPEDIENQKVVFKKDKSSMIDSLIFHIRNRFPPRARWPPIRPRRMKRRRARHLYARWRSASAQSLPQSPSDRTAHPRKPRFSTRFPPLLILADMLSAASKAAALRQNACNNILSGVYSLVNDDVRRPCFLSPF